VIALDFPGAKGAAGIEQVLSQAADYSGIVRGGKGSTGAPQRESGLGPSLRAAT